MESRYLLESLVKDLEYKLADAKKRQTDNARLQVVYWAREELCQEILNFISRLEGEK